MINVNIHLNKKDTVKIDGYAVDSQNGYVVFKVEAREDYPNSGNEVTFFIHNEEFIDQMIKKLQKAKKELKKMNEVTQEV